ncbi:hypothetical protein ACE15K_29000 (plasmid) [Citrobacter farmeri]
MLVLQITITGGGNPSSLKGEIINLRNDLKIRANRALEILWILMTTFRSPGSEIHMQNIWLWLFPDVDIVKKAALSEAVFVAYERLINQLKSQVFSHE